MATIFDIDTVGKNYYLIIRLTLRPDSQIHYTVIYVFCLNCNITVYVNTCQDYTQVF